MNEKGQSLSFWELQWLINIGRNNVLWEICVLTPIIIFYNVIKRTVFY